MRGYILAFLGVLLATCLTTAWAVESREESEVDVDGAGINEAPALGIAISDFDPESDEFSFENYGNETPTVDLTSVEMRRLFGDKVCARVDGGDECLLTPPAERWLRESNKDMGEGHCTGMAVLSMFIFLGLVDPSGFGASVAHDLVLEGNEPLQREIAYWWATDGEIPADLNNISGPTVVLDTLERTIEEGEDAHESYYLAVRNANGDGHAVTPIGAEEERGGIAKILVYDPNYPDEVRSIEIDRNEDTFTFEFTPDPEGEADIFSGKDLALKRNSRRMELQECDFCIEAADRGKDSKEKLALGEKTMRYVQISLYGLAELLITDEQGRRIGQINKTFINEIPGARIHKPLDQKPREKTIPYRPESGPEYLLPDGLNFTVTVDGSWLEKASDQELTVIGPGYDLLVEDLWLDPGEQDHVDVSTANEDYKLTYRSNYTESPDIIIGTDGRDADYEFVVRGIQVESGRISAELDNNRGEFILDTLGINETGKFGLLMHRIDDKGEQYFGNDDIILRPYDTLYLDFLAWKGDGTSIPLRIDHGSNGSIDETLELKDESDFYKDYYEDWEGNANS
jgi:hypothetical protein